MRIGLIKTVVLAAILLPFTFMVIEGLLLIRYSMNQYRVLENDRRLSDVLARGGSISATEVLGELMATRRFLARPGDDTRTALAKSRSALDNARHDFYMSLPAASAVDPGFSVQLSNLKLAYSRIIAVRSGVDAGRYTAKSDGTHIYAQAALKQLGIVDSLTPLISDDVLLRKSDELVSILLTYFGERLINNMGVRYFDTNGFSGMSHDQLVQGQVLLGTGLDRLRFHTSSHVVKDILAFRAQPREMRLETLTQAMLTGALKATPILRGEWMAGQGILLDFLKDKVDAVTADIHSTGAKLAARSHHHLLIMFLLSGGLLLLVAVVAVLAVQGVRLVSRVMKERGELIAELRDAAQTDLLTGLFNRRGFEAAASALLVQAEHGSRLISVVLFDLDHFKQVNDTHGHDAGDAVLREVAAIARKHFREFDLLVRHGGEEFLALLPDLDAEGAAVVAEDVRAAIETADIDIRNGQSLKLTASFGCAGRLGTPAKNDFEGLVKSADTALYAAKASGRNRVVVSGDYPRIVTQVETSPPARGRSKKPR